MKIKTFCRCSSFPSWSGKGLISTPVFVVLKIAAKCLPSLERQRSIGSGVTANLQFGCS